MIIDVRWRNNKGDIKRLYERQQKLKLCVKIVEYKVRV